MTTVAYTKKDFTSDQEVKWCPGCGDYAILSSVQLAMTKIGKKKEEIVFISGIGCSSRFPYYMNTYGMHTIHGRAPAVATGLLLQNPNLSVWVVTGDGDGLSIGGNHLIHTLRRNVNLRILVFNNEIYGLTKGQYSPTSHKGLVTKSSPYGSVDRAFSPCQLALGAGATFIAKTLDTDPKHMMDIFVAAEQHQGISFIEIYQNCVIFNDAVHDPYTAKETREDLSIRLTAGAPMIFGKEKNKGIRLKGVNPEIVEIGKDGVTQENILVYDPTNPFMAQLAINLSYPDFPMTLGILKHEKKLTSYEVDFHRQIEEVKTKKGMGDMQKVLSSGDTWEVK